MELAKPWELMEVQDGQSITFGVLRYEVGEVSIVDRRSNLVVTIPTMRAFVRPGDKKAGMNYWDITSLTLQAQLRPWLDNPATRNKTFTVRAHGIRPAKRFQLEAA